MHVVAEAMLGHLVQKTGLQCDKHPTLKRPAVPATSYLHSGHDDVDYLVKGSCIYKAHQDCVSVVFQRRGYRETTGVQRLHEGKLLGCC